MWREQSESKDITVLLYSESMFLIKLIYDQKIFTF